MLNADKLFENLFDSPKIISARLYAFAQNTLNNLIIANGSGANTDIIKELTDVNTILGTDLGVVDTSEAIKRGATLSNDQMLKSFSKAMSEEKPFIARALGGEGNPRFLEFYPNGLEEYSNPAKTDMPVLTNRINAAAIRYEKELGKPLFDKLVAFESQWTQSRDVQEKKKGSVADAKKVRDVHVTDVELVLTKIVHVVAAQAPGNVAHAAAIFDFSLLYPRANEKHTVIEGQLDFGDKKMISNRLFADKVEIVATNESDNSEFVIYLSDTPNGDPTTKAITVPFDQTILIDPATLGDPKHPFLIIKSTSTVNPSKYKIEIIG